MYCVHFVYCADQLKYVLCIADRILSTLIVLAASATSIALIFEMSSELECDNQAASGFITIDDSERCFECERLCPETMIVYRPYIEICIPHPLIIVERQ